MQNFWALGASDNWGGFSGKGSVEDKMSQPLMSSCSDGPEQQLFGSETYLFTLGIVIRST